MNRTPELPRLDQRIQRSKRVGKIVLGGVLLVSLVLGAVLVQGLLLALDAQGQDLVSRALLGLGLILALDLFSIHLTLRQHRMLDEAREELARLVEGDPVL